MTSLVEDLLLLARLDEGQELVMSGVDLTRLAVESLADAQVAGRDHEWSLDVPDESVMIVGDGARMHQVLANLLANARVHTPAGTHVGLSVTREDGDAVVRVSDDGPGIEESVAESSSRGLHVPIVPAHARPAARGSGCPSCRRSSRRTTERSPSKAGRAARSSRCVFRSPRSSSDETGSARAVRLAHMGMLICAFMTTRIAIRERRA